MSEELLTITSPDQTNIYGKIRKTGSSDLIIHFHGMTHSMHHMLEVTGADYFTDAGFDHYRVSLYDRLPGSRRLNNSTITTHIADMQAVIDYFREKYESIFISAHSLSGLCMLILNPKDIRGISLWDPAFDITHFWEIAKCLTHLPDRKEYHIDYGNVFVVSEDFVEEIKNYPDAKCLEMAKNFHSPVQMIIPEISIFLASPHTSPENYRKAFPENLDLQYVKGAIHTFSNENDRGQLFKMTADWFKTKKA